MMKTQLKYTAVLTISAVLFGCGGGGGSSATAPTNAAPENKGTTVPAVVDTGKTDPAKTDPAKTDPAKTDTGTTGTGNTDSAQQPDQSAGSQRLADGVWFGNEMYTNGAADPFTRAFALVASMGKDQPTQIYIASQYPDAYAARNSGKITLSQGAITGSDILDVNHASEPFSLGGNAVAANTLTATLFKDKTEFYKYQFNYSADYQNAAGLDKLQGTYEATTTTFSHGSVKVDAQGKLTGEVRDCEISGQISLLDDHNMYRIALHVKPTRDGFTCLGLGTGPRDITGEVDMTGLATLATLPNESTPSLLFAASATQAGGKFAMLASAMAKK